MAERFLDYAEARLLARRYLPRALFDYIDRGTEGENGIHALRSGFDAQRIVPRTLRLSTTPDLSLRILDRNRPSPFIIAPTALAGLVRHGGEVKLARAAASLKMPVCLSTQASSRIEDVARDAPDAELWFQLYVWKDRAETWRLLDRAWQCGIETLLLTVDTPASPKKIHNIRNGFSIPLRPSPRLILDLLRHWKWTIGLIRQRSLPSYANYPQGAGVNVTQTINDPRFAIESRLDANFVTELRYRWKGVLLLKGVLHPDDARSAIDAGCDGVVVSSHGGRNLDCAITPLEVLPRIRAAIPHAILLADSGVQRGSDAARLLSEGIDGVLLGRAPLFGLAAGGENGAAHMLGILESELRAFMTFAGVGDLGELRSLEWYPQQGKTGITA